MHCAGISGMRARISETAKWGDVTAGPKIIDAQVKARMAEVLKKIRSGKFAQEWLRETATGRKWVRKRLAEGKVQPNQQTGDWLRRLMPWLQEPP